MSSCARGVACMSRVEMTAPYGTNISTLEMRARRRGHAEGGDVGAVRRRHADGAALARRLRVGLRSQQQRERKDQCEMLHRGSPKGARPPALWFLEAAASTAVFNHRRIGLSPWHPHP